MKIVIAVDDSLYSAKVLESLSLRQWPIDTAFKIISVVQNASPFESKNENWKEFEKLAFDRRKRLAIEICTQGKNLFKARLPHCNVHIDIREGDPRDKIVESAVEWMADKILIGAHGRDLSDRVLWGGVSRAVATNAKCTVQIVRPARAHKDEKQSHKEAVIVI
ncbi:MAG: universal stress protein [Leptolyngbya sp.]|nr:universal stress protein [Candidatus Melainabacteria bacterium]